MKSLARSLGINLVGVVFVAISGFVSVILMARWLDIAQFGTVSLLLLLFNSIALFDGVRPVLVYMGAQSPDFPRLIRTAEVTMAAVGFAIACLSMVVFAISDWQHLVVPQIILFSAALGVYFPLSAYWGLLDSRGETAFTGGLRSAAWTAAYIAFIVLAWFQTSLAWYVVVMALMNLALLAAYGARLYAVHAEGSGGFDRNLMRRIWRDAADNLILNASAFVLASADRFVLGLQRGAAELGLYSGPYELTTKPGAFLRVLAAVLYPEAAQRQDDARFTELWLRILKLLFFAVTCGVFVAVLYREQLVRLILGDKFAAAADPFGLLSVGFALSSLSYLAAIPLHARGDFRTQRTLYVIAACCMGALVWPTIVLGGITGAAALFLASRIVDPVLLLAAFKKLDKPVSIERASLVSVLFCSVMLAAWYGFATIGLLCLIPLAFSIGVPQLAIRSRAGGSSI